MLFEDDKATLRISLCRMCAMPLVRPVLKTVILRLHVEFSYGYRSRDRVFMYQPLMTRED